MKTYWNGEGKAQAKYDVLHKQIPYEGECPKDRPKLERLRKAANAYYQLYNNGNFSAFTRIFGVSGTKVFNDSPEEIEASEDKLTEIIEAAYVEFVNFPTLFKVDGEWGMKALDLVPLFAAQHPWLKYAKPERVAAFMSVWSDWPQPVVKRGRGGRRNRKNRGGK